MRNLPTNVANCRSTDVSLSKALEIVVSADALRGPLDDSHFAAAIAPRPNIARIKRARKMGIVLFLVTV
jgi:hypothetical protein